MPGGNRLKAGPEDFGKIAAAILVRLKRIKTKTLFLRWLLNPANQRS